MFVCPVLCSRVQKYFLRLIFDKRTLHTCTPHSILVLKKQVLDHVAFKSRSKVLKAKLKSIIRIFEKAALEYGGDMSRITDFVRGKIFCDTIDQLGLVVACLVLCDPGLAADPSLAGLLGRAEGASGGLGPPATAATPAAPAIPVARPQIKILNVKNRIGTFCMRARIRDAV